MRLLASEVMKYADRMPVNRRLVYSMPYIV